jgi:hypothetical protein
MRRKQSQRKGKQNCLRLGKQQRRLLLLVKIRKIRRKRRRKRRRRRKLMRGTQLCQPTEIAMWNKMVKRWW